MHALFDIATANQQNKARLVSILKALRRFKKSSRACARSLSRFCFWTIYLKKVIESMVNVFRLTTAPPSFFFWIDKFVSNVFGMFQTQLSIRLGFTARFWRAAQSEGICRKLGSNSFQTYLDMLQKVGDTTGNATHLSIFSTFQLVVQNFNFKPAFWQKYQTILYYIWTIDCNGNQK